MLLLQKYSKINIFLPIMKALDELMLIVVDM